MPITPTDISTSDSVIATASSQRVYTRRRWVDEWEEVPALWCEDFDECVSPSIPEARLVYIYGEGIEPGADTTERRAFQQLDPKDLLHHYVKIEVYPTAYGDPPTALDLDEPILWYGTIEEVMRDHAGSLPSDQTGDERVPTGRQYFRCMGLELLLERTLINSAWVFDYSQPDVFEIQRPITFNAGLGQPRDSERRGNMFGASEPIFYFSGPAATAAEGHESPEEWTSKHILEYLIRRHEPMDLEGDTPFDFALDPEGCHANLEADKPIIDPTGRTLKSLLDQIIDRRRLHTWKLVVDEEEDQILVRVVSYTPEEINLEEDPALSITSLQPNPIQKQLDFERAFDIVSAVTVQSLSHGYDQVVVRGAKRGCVGTFCEADGTLGRGWDVEGALHQAYEDGATAEDGYDDADTDAQWGLNKTARQQPKFDSIFSYFVVPSDWDGKVGDGEGGQTYAICPELDTFPDATIYLADSVPLWRGGLRFQRWLALEVTEDYSGTGITDRIPDGETRPPDPSPDAIYQHIQAFIEYQAEDGDISAAYCDLSKLSEARIPEGADAEVAEYQWSAHVAPLENDLGVELRASDGKYGQYLLDLGSFDFTEDEEALIFGLPDGQSLSWEKVRVTAMIEADEYCQAKYPTEIESLEAGDVPRILTIDVGDRCRLDYVAPGTWVGVKAGQKLQTTNGGFVRDDRLILRNLARLAGAWYLLPRQEFSLVFRQIRPLVRPGELIITIKQGGEDVDVNALCTRVRYDLNQQTTTIQTDFGELDLSGALR